MKDRIYISEIEENVERIPKWKIIPKEKSAYTAVTLVAKSNKTRHGYILKIPLSLRKQSEYFTSAKSSHVNFLEKGKLLMIQFVPDDQIGKDTHTMHYGTLSISKNVIDCDMRGKKRKEIKHYIDNHNIIIDRKPFKKLHKNKKGGGTNEKS